MAIRINNILLDLDDDMETLKNRASKKLNVPLKHIKDFKIVKESIDARKRNLIKINYCIDVECEDEYKIIKKLSNNKNIKLEEKPYERNVEYGHKILKHRPVIVGMGPAGMFAGLLLARNGYKPIIFERGEQVEHRTKSVERFWKDGILNLESNVQFGEGGAGTFSDGKLTTRIKDNRCDFILEEFVRAGAPEEIIYKGKPHIGTDILKVVVKNIREEIIRLGGTVHFSSKLEKINIRDGKLYSILVNGEERPCSTAILALGHSSRDTYEMLHEMGIPMEAKPFAIGVRVEHIQELIDTNQYGKFAAHPKLRAADYRLTYTSKNSGRAVYSFCMCPGGEVVAAASEEERLVTNGMSYYKRDKENANAAIVVTVGPKDFEGSDALSGMKFQRYYEGLAYKLGGGGYKAPIQAVEDFLQDRVTTKLGKVIPTYTPGYEFKDLRNCLPPYVVDTLKEGFKDFDKKINGFISKDAIMTGIETRTSAPVKILRDEKLQSISVKGLYPAGEGAGFAGGIVSAGVDGLKAAESIMKEYYPLY